MDGLNLDQFEDFDNGENLCFIWFSAYLKEKFAPLIVALAVNCINTVEEVIFIKMSYFDRDKFITQRLKSSMVKLLVMFYMNVTLTMILIYHNIEEIHE